VKLPTLYKTTSVGKIQEWDISVKKNIITILYGVQNGKKQIKTDKITKGKNIGKANETTPEEQAELEAMARWTKQRDRRGYSEEVGEYKFKPMLAKIYNDHPHKVKFPCYVQPKLNGLRATFRDGKFWSRTGQHFEAMDFLAKQFDTKQNLDGEFYIHGVQVTTINGYCAKIQSETLQVEYHVYDQICKGNFKNRYDSIKLPYHPLVKLVETIEVNSHEEIQPLFDDYITRGFEGAMIRNDGPYKEGRSFDLLKLKEHFDDEFEIVGMAHNDRMPGTGKFLLITKAGVDF
jgi:DNA ligase-1